MLKPHIYIPIEIIPRELDSKILFSLFAAKSGYRIYIGTKKSINHILKKKQKLGNKSGIFFYKSQFISEYKNMSKLIQKVCDKFVILDEELGPVVKNVKQILNKRLKNIKNIDQFYVIGNEMKYLVMNNKKELSKKIFITGWPRIDLWSKKFSKIYDRKVKSIKKEFGEYIIFSSDFGAISKSGLSDIIRHFKKKKKYQPIVKTFKKSFKDYLEFRSFIKSASKISKKKIIIRPHPADRYHSTWYEDFKGEKNIHIIYDDDISPWLLGSSAMIHRGCTTAIQSYFYGKPIYYWQSRIPLKNNDKTLSYLISKKIRNINDFKNIKFKKNNYFNENNKLIKNKIHFSNNSYSCKKILENLKKLKYNKEKPFEFELLGFIKGFILDKCFRILIKLDIKKDEFSKNFAQKQPYNIDASLIKSKGKIMFPKNNFIIKNISFNLVSIEEGNKQTIDY